ncbi:MAG: hypothetical protein GZ091_16240 [Paludibacter sp.]|nr:hypothetical protein [Paludibacter sp.]
MSYNPKINHRRSIRLKGYDYSQNGLYFVTICCHDRICRFGDVGAGLAPAQMVLNEFGQIAYNEWANLPKRFTNFELDVFQIMPNHIHGIIVLNKSLRGITSAQNDAIAKNDDNVPQNTVYKNDAVIQNDMDTILRAGASPAPTTVAATTNASVSDIVGAYKSLVANACLEIWKLKWAGVVGASPAPTMGKLWQRNYHEHIIRDEQSYQFISNYIINNPAKWNEDKFYNSLQS